MQDATNPTAVDEWLHSLHGATREFASIFMTPAGEICGWAGAAQLLFGYGVQEAVGMPFARLFTPEDAQLGLDRQERELALTGGRSEDDRWHVRKDGTRFWGSGVMESVCNAAGETVVLAKTVRDRTDIRVQVTTLQNRLAESERLHVERMQFMAALAHEFRNQLAPVANSVALMTHRPDQPLPLKAMATMRDKLQVMARLMDDLAEASQESISRPRLAFAPVDVQAAVRRAADSASADVARRGQELHITLPEAPIVIEADPSRLDQMLVNLLSNASKFTPAGGKIQFSATVEEDMAAIRVEDDGVGIAPDVLPRIFELFTRESRDDAPDGMGVGLAVVKQLATLHGGFIEGRSPGRGNGSIFTLRLPTKQDTRPRASLP